MTQFKNRITYKESPPMDARTLLTKCITLRFRESQIQNATEISTTLIRAIVEMIKTPEGTLTLDPEGEIILGLKSLALSMADEPISHIFSIAEILQQVTIIGREDNSLIRGIETGIMNDLSQDLIKQLCINLRRSLSNYFREKTAEKIIQMAAYKIRFERPSILSVPRFIQELITELEPYQKEAVTDDPAILSDVSVGEISQMVDVYNQIKDEADGSMKLLTGYQGFNRMLDGGFRRGEYVVMGALQHNFKTGFSLTVFRQVAQYNEPKTYDPNKKPLLLRISFEDDVILNLQFIFASLKQLETGVFPGADQIRVESAEDMAAYVYEALGKLGWTIKFLRVDPTQWTYLDLINYVLKLESMGYEVVMCMVDYLKMMPTTGCIQGATGQDVRDLFRRTRNFFAPRKTTFFTPHQLSTEAKMMTRINPADFLKEIANKGYWDGCKTIDNEVDLELYINIVPHGPDSWLEIQRGKHRKVGQTPREHLYMALPFTPDGIILDDINGVDTTRRKVGAGLIGSVDEKPHWTLDSDY